MAPRPGLDALFLDVGNALGPGVIDHHHLPAESGSAARFLFEHPDLVMASLNPARGANEPFTLYVHAHPDLDSVASVYLAIERLTAGRFPNGSDALLRYVDAVDGGFVGASPSNPHSLYVAYRLRAQRLSERRWASREELWRASMEDGLTLVARATESAWREGKPLEDVDAFAASEILTPQDRDEVSRDLERYRRILQHPTTHTRRVKLALPKPGGGRAEVPGLLVRDLGAAGDKEPCLFFKDWARNDASTCPETGGFVALSVFTSESPAEKRRCILSVRRGAGVWLNGLGAALDAAEASERARLHGQDDRVRDLETGALKPPRPGYDNADPWYDGRAHGYTIVDAPRSGTVLSADRIDDLFLGFGAA